MRDRLNKVITYTESTVNSFSKQLGVSQSALAQYLRGGSNNISANLLVSLHREYPNIDLHWLITGEGKMLRQPAEQELKINKSLSLLQQVADIISELR